MDTQKTSVKKIALNYGLILGLSSVLISVVVYVMGQHLERPLWASLLGLVIMAAVIVYGLKEAIKWCKWLIIIIELTVLTLNTSIHESVFRLVWNQGILAVICLTIIEIKTIIDSGLVIMEFYCISNFELVLKKPNLTRIIW